MGQGSGSTGRFLCKGCSGLWLFDCLTKTEWCVFYLWVYGWTPHFWWSLLVFAVLSKHRYCCLVYGEFLCVQYSRDIFIIKTEPSSTNICKHQRVFAALPSMHHLYGGLPSWLHCAESWLHSLFWLKMSADKSCNHHLMLTRGWICWTSRLRPWSIFLFNNLIQSSASANSFAWSPQHADRLSGCNSF